MLFFCSFIFKKGLMTWCVCVWHFFYVRSERKGRGLKKKKRFRHSFVSSVDAQLPKAIRGLSDTKDLCRETD
jgi:hypothetical protein